ncbi:MAG TPA: MFS transporter [Candidatus Kapabacteria bacterium]|nr:MFS transporter [Candidatus Kapabacteria bacterium]
MLSSKKELTSWYLYDWANSAYSTTVITLFLGPYLTTIAKDAQVNGLVNFFGFSIPAGSIFPYSITISVILQVLILPIIGGIADYSRRKKSLLGIFAISGAILTTLFFFLDDGLYIYGSILLIFSNLFFGCSIIVYNSFLNDISSYSERERVSSKGWATGYVGGGLLLILNLILFLFHNNFGLTNSLAVRINLASAGVWWGLFSIPSLIYLKSNPSKANYKKMPFSYAISGSFKSIIATFKDAKNYPMALLFLLAYLFYNDGVQSVITLSSLFGQEELGLELTFLTIVILVVQFVAALGSMIFYWATKKLGEKNTLVISIILWCCVIFYAFAFLSGKIDFFILAIIIALLMGGTQAISRSLYSKLIPIGKEAEYFSIYEISEKGTSWLGPFAFGLIFQLTRSYRFAILSLLIFFVVGGIILVFSKIRLNNQLQISPKNEFEN